MSTLIGRLLVGTKLDPSGFKSGARKSTKHLTAFERRTKSIGASITRTMGAMGAAFAIGSIVQGAAKTVSDFDQKVANLAATTGQSKSNIGALVQNAKDVGAVSAFSASQVLDLQTELAKLGNSEKEIISMTKAVGDFSIAVGATAADAAILTGGVLKSFGKTAKETESVVNSLAVATTKSALDFNKLNVALPLVGTAADQSGISLERTVSLLGVLADRNIDASTSGTALRNIFLDLKAKGLTYEEAMSQINNSTDKLNTANELFGKRGAVVATVLAESSTQADILEKSITNVDGALKKMTDERLNTLQGQITLTKSAWEGFVLSLDQGDGVFSKIVKETVGGLKDIITTATELNKGGLFSDSENGFKNTLLLLMGSDETRARIISDLEKTRNLQNDIASGARLESGGFRAQRGGGLGGLRDKKIGTDKLGEAIEDLNKKTNELDESGGAKVLSFKDKISELEGEISTLAETYIKGGEGNKNILSSITDKQAKIVELNSSLEKTESLLQRLSEGGSRDQVGVQSILSGNQRNGFGNNTLGSQKDNNITIDPDYIERSIQYTKDLAAATTALAGVYPTLGEAAGSALGALGSALESGAASFKEFVGSILSGIQNVIGALIKQTVASAIAGAFTSLPLPIALGAAAAIGGLASGIFNTALNSLSVPKLADGGVISKPTYAMLGEYPGASRNPEIAAPESKLRNIFGSELSRHGGGGRMYSVTKGSDIYTSQDKYNYRLNRTG